jgi:RHH-type rel operon transcriptional repressor/antitoxin RelB
MLSIDLPKEIEARLTRLCEETGQSQHYYVQQAILHYLEDLEDFYLAEARMQSLDEQKVVSLDCLVVRYGLED